MNRTGSNLRSLLRWIWIRLLCLLGLLRWAEWQLVRRGAVVVLTFHRVLSDVELAQTNSPPGMVVKQNTFNELLKSIADHYRFVPLKRGEREDSGRRLLRFAATFDDGWQDNYSAAMGVSTARTIPLAIFICPAKLDRTLPFWPENVSVIWRESVRQGTSSQILNLCSKFAQGLSGGYNTPRDLESIISFLKKLKPAERSQLIDDMRAQVTFRTQQDVSVDATMNWNQVQELARADVSFGCHTNSHEILTNLSIEEAWAEIIEAKKQIEQELGGSCQLFSYPNGEWSSAVRELVVESGFELAFANQTGAWVKETNLHAIPRVNIWEGAITSPGGRFSEVCFRYVAIWKTYLAVVRAKHSASLT